jgi:hypothetical protein
LARDFGWLCEVLCSAAHLDHSLAHYLGDERTDRGAILNSDDHFVPCDRPGCETIGSFPKANNDALQPLFERCR